MTKNYALRSADEATTHELLDGFAHDPMHSTVQCLKKVFRAQWALAVRADTIKPLAEMLSNYPLLDEDVNKVLSLMVRRKVLRTRTQGGNKFYEVNY